VGSIETVLASGISTPDLGGDRGTDAVTDAVIASFLDTEASL